MDLNTAKSFFVFFFFLEEKEERRKILLTSKLICILKYPYFTKPTSFSFVYLEKHCILLNPLLFKAFIQLNTQVLNKKSLKRKRQEKTIFLLKTRKNNLPFAFKGYFDILLKHKTKILIKKYLKKIIFFFCVLHEWAIKL